MDMGEAADEDEEDEDLRSAKTFMDVGADDEDEDEEDDDFRAAKTFMDMGEAADEDEEDEDLRSAKTFMEVGADEDADDDDDVAPKTFMDLGGDSDANISSTRVEAKADGRKRTFLEQTDFNVASGQTFMDVGGGEETSSGIGSASGVRGGDTRGGDDDGTFMDLGSGSRSGAGSSTSLGNTDAGSGTGSRSGSSSGVSSSGVGSQTEAEAESKSGKKGKKKKKGGKKKDAEDAYSHPLVGKVIGGCRIVKKLGEGGMGAVFLAEHTRLKRQSVIKVIPAHLSSNKQLIARFQREAQAAAVIQHPNVVNVFNVGDENGVHFIEMEYVDGDGLDSLMKKKKIIPQMDAVRIIKEACKGLNEAHKHGIVHRDIKPDNIMLTRKGQVKIADFGLARASSGDAELTKVGQILGTPAYMSPEQCQGKPTDHRCDIYSLGATFYAMVTGKRPFTGSSVMEIMQKHIDEQPISPREYNPDLSIQVAKIILTMMAKKLEDRYQSGEEIVEALDQFLKEEGSEHLEKIQRAIGERFTLIKKLGQGGMGAVYSAKANEDGERLQTGDVVAIKVLTQDVSQEDVERFRLEAELARKVDHKAIVQVLEYKISKEVNYIVMEFVEGESVRDLLRDNKVLPQTEAIRIVKAAAFGLHAAHEKGIVHRDIKPDNIMVTKDGHVKLADFGVAKSDDAKSELTQAGFLVGTPHYMSPEQCSGEAGVEVTNRADIYALGATLYFMCTGQKPFEGDTQPTILLQHMKTPAKPPHEVNDQVTEGLSNVILNMMAKRPEKRYASLTEVIAELEKVEKGGTPKKRRGVEVPFGESAAGKKTVGILLGVAALALIGFGLFLQWYQQTEGQRIYRSSSEKMATAWQEGLPGLQDLVAKRQFAQAFSALELLDDKVEASDATPGKAIYPEYAPKVAEKRKELEAARRDRDERVAAVKKEAEQALTALSAAVTAFEQQLAAEVQRTAEADKASTTTIRALLDLRRIKAEPVARLRDALLPLYRLIHDPETRYGDTAERAWAQRQADDAQRGVDALGDRLLRAVWNELAEKQYTSRDLQYYDDAGRQVAAVFEHFPTEVVVDAERGWKTTLTVVGAVRERIAQIETWDKEQLAHQTQRIMRDRFHEAEAQLAEQLHQEREAEAKGLVHVLDYVGLIAAYEGVLAAESQNPLPVGASSAHRRPATDRITELKRKRADKVTTLRDDLRGQAEALAGAGKYKDALTRLEEQKGSLPEIFSADEASNRQKVRDDIQKQIVETQRMLADVWRRERDEIEALAWKERRFIDADRRYEAIENDPQKALVLPGDVRTIHEQVRALRARFATNLALLRPALTARIPAGSYPVGDDAGYPIERPRKDVELKRELLIDRTEVRVADYIDFLTTTRQGMPPSDELAGVPGPLARRHVRTEFCHPDEPASAFGHAPAYLLALDAEGKPLEDENGQWSFNADLERSRPVVDVTWYDAWAFARWAGKRLPAESEWEIAASVEVELGPDGRGHAVAKRRYPWGDAFDRDKLACPDDFDDWNRDDLPAAGSNLAGASPCGALDMAGSVWEWCEDPYQPYDERFREADPDFGLSYRVIRGGGFSDYYEVYHRTTFRNRALPTTTRPMVGFRCVRAALAGE